MVHVLMSRCFRMGGLQKFGIMLFTSWWIWNLVRTYMQIPHLRDLQYFYQTVLNVKDVSIKHCFKFLM